MPNYNRLSSHHSGALSAGQGFRIFGLALLVVVVYTLTSCGGGEAPPPPQPATQHGAAESKEQPASKEKKSKEKEKEKDKRARRARLSTSDSPVEAYSIKSERDPFRPLLMPKKVQQQQVTAAPLTPLQTYDSESFRVVGIVWGELGKKAIIQAPDGKGYFVSIGTLIGKNMGHVVEISSSTVIIEEKIVDIQGKETTRAINLEIKKEKEEG